MAIGNPLSPDNISNSLKNPLANLGIGNFQKPQATSTPVSLPKQSVSQVTNKMPAPTSNEFMTPVPQMSSIPMSGGMNNISMFEKPLPKINAQSTLPYGVGNNIGAIAGVNAPVFNPVIKTPEFQQNYQKEQQNIATQRTAYNNADKTFDEANISSLVEPKNEEKKASPLDMLVKIAKDNVPELQDSSLSNGKIMRAAYTTIPEYKKIVDDNLKDSPYMINPIKDGFNLIYKPYDQLTAEQKTKRDMKDQEGISSFWDKLKIDTKGLTYLKQSDLNKQMLNPAHTNWDTSSHEDKVNYVKDNINAAFSRAGEGVATAYNLLIPDMGELIGQASESVKQSYKKEGLGGAALTIGRGGLELGEGVINLGVKIADKLKNDPIGATMYALDHPAETAMAIEGVMSLPGMVKAVKNAPASVQGIVKNSYEMFQDMKKGVPEAIDDFKARYRESVDLANKQRAELEANRPAEIMPEVSAKLKSSNPIIQEGLENPYVGEHLNKIHEITDGNMQDVPKTYKDEAIKVIGDTYILPVLQKVEETYKEGGSLYNDIKATKQIINTDGLDIEARAIAEKYKPSTMNPKDKALINNALAKVDEIITDKTFDVDTALKTRRSLSDLVQRDEKGTIGEQAVKEIRRILDERMKTQVKGLKEIDSMASTKIDELKAFKKQLVTKEGTINYSNLKSAGEGKLAKTALAERLDEFVPGATDKINAIDKAIQIAKTTKGMNGLTKWTSRTVGALIGGHFGFLGAGVGLAIEGLLEGKLSKIMSDAKQVKVLKIFEELTPEAKNRLNDIATKIEKRASLSEADNKLIEGLKAKFEEEKVLKELESTKIKAKQEEFNNQTKALPAPGTANTNIGTSENPIVSKGPKPKQILETNPLRNGGSNSSNTNSIGTKKLGSNPLK